VMERGVEYGGIELFVRKWQTADLGLETREEFQQARLIMPGSAQSILIIGEQVHRTGSIPGQRQAITHPAVARAEVKDPAVAFGAIQQMADKVVVAAGPHPPLFAVSSGLIPVGQVEVE